VLKKLVGLLCRIGDARRQVPLSSADSSSKVVPSHFGNRRATNFWEPIFGPSVMLDAEPYDWDIDHSNQPVRRFIPGEILTNKLKSGETLTVKGITFTDCDFQGQFLATAIVVFDGCHFLGCDFAYSSWNSAHFKNCRFKDTSISIARFEKCEFRGCTWDRVGVSGNKTDLIHTFIENPEKLIKAMSSGTDPQKSGDKEHACYQWFRLAGTRAHVLRSIMISHASVGDEHIYYKTVGLHEIQRNQARLREDWYHFRFGSLKRRFKAVQDSIFHALNLILIWLLGRTNAWGESVSRPSVLFVAVYVAFAFTYTLPLFTDQVVHPWQKSFDITLLIGFTNHNEPEDRILTIIQNIHAVVALVLYTVFFSTLVSKLSRIR